MSFKKRACGLLCHITCLPSAYGIGDLGPQAYRFVDFMSEIKQQFWQILPLSPTNPMSGNSPYSSASAFAGNPLLISPEELVKSDLLLAEDLESLDSFSDHFVDFDTVISSREILLAKAFERFQENESKFQTAFDNFCHDHSIWLEDYVTFRAFKIHFDQKAWTGWLPEIKNREPTALDELKKELEKELYYGRFIQFVFYQQWQKLKYYCNEKGIQIVGDIPYYVNYDSADVWSHPELFKLDRNKRPKVVAGVPPDYFSQTGQLWGNPIYDWERLKETGFDWWLLRIGHNLSLYDQIRIDHFRGMVAFWQVPAKETTAINGKWMQVPIYDFLDAVLKKFPDLPIIAEDLGYITDDVRQVLSDYNLPGMKVLQFAFDHSLPQNLYAPHNHVQNCVLYIGTHDNNTVKGWFAESDDATKSRLGRYINKWLETESIHWDMMAMALKSVADVTILTMQDLLGLGSEAKMNTPGTRDGNWTWRFTFAQIPSDLKDRLNDMIRLYGRDPDDPESVD